MSLLFSLFDSLGRWLSNPRNCIKSGDVFEYEVLVLFFVYLFIVLFLRAGSERRVLVLLIHGIVGVVLALTLARLAIVGLSLKLFVGYLYVERVVVLVHGRLQNRFLIVGALHRFVESLYGL